jgi:hypothetical protein
MTGNKNHIVYKLPEEYVLPGIRGYCTSFMEFVPFCLHLYYFSSFKAFKKVAQA